MTIQKLFIFAGERSGDLHGSHLITALKALKPPLSFTAVAGPKMRTCEIKCLLPMEKFQVMGFTDVLFHLPKLYRHFHFICRHIQETKPDVVILIDYPGFNLRLAKALRKRGYTGKIVQYICPSVWAHGKGRVETLEEAFDLLLTIYPFENKYFSLCKLSLCYVGNPLCEYIESYPYDIGWKQKAVNNHENLIALFPGSREHEIKRHLPLILGTAEKILQSEPNAVFGLSLIDNTSLKLIENIVKKYSQALQKALFFVPVHYTYELMQGAKSAIAKSGTVTLELALHRCPTVVIYTLTKLNRLIAKYILRVNLPYYCIVNILLKKQTFIELIDKAPNPSSIYAAYRKMNEDRLSCLSDLDTLKNLLKNELKQAPSEAAAKAVLGLE